MTVLATGQSAPVESNHALPAYQAGPFNRLGRGGQADDGGHGPQRVRAQPGSGRRLHPGSFIILMRKAEALIPSGSPPIPLRTGARPGAFTFHGGGRRSRLPARGADPTAFQAAPAPGRFILQERRADDLNATPCGAHPLATEPGSPVRFTLHE